MDAGVKKSGEVQLNRACEACRVSKVRCLVNQNSSSSQCERCAKAGRQCVFAPPAKRRQRKRTDVRVAELEKELKHLTALLKPNSTIPPIEEDDHDESMDDDELEPTESPERKSSGYSQSQDSSIAKEPLRSNDPWPPRQNISRNDTRHDLLTTDNDIIDRGVITIELAESLLKLYREELFVDYPGITIPKEVTANELRSKKPALFHAVMAAASQGLGSALSNKLHEELVYFYARSLFVNGEKSLQHVQALFISVAYYTPPNNPGQMQIYQYTNLAASMALELGLASKPRTHEQLPKRAIRSLQRISSADELLEHCRTILSLYTIIAGLSMRFRRPNILLFNSWMGECEALLLKSPKTQDKTLIAWLRLQRIADEAYTAFGFDDASTSFTLSELRLQAILKIFERRMQEWKKAVPDEVMTMTLSMEFHQNMMSMWEFAMDGGKYDAPEFRNRHMTLPALDDDACIQPESLLSRSSLQINATIMCISSAHSILDCFLQMSISKLQRAAGINFVRACFALVALLKVDYAVGTDAEGMGEVIDSKSLKIDFYLDSVIRITTEAEGPQKCRIPGHWRFVLKEKLKTWHDEHQEWRRNGGHLKRSKKAQAMIDANTSSVTTDVLPPYTSQAQQLPTPSPLTTSPSLTEQPQIPRSQGLDFVLGGTQLPVGTWQPPAFRFPTTSGTQTPGLNDQMYTGPDMTDFSAAFQNGDLYLWDDINDNYGGWMPQGGTMYSDVPFNGMNF
ncbi:uncharacterized protein CC84DRAFT_1083823 [Paraphaeosphaeria sporulosa]|uniref:Zn(2)-C6 fungal-type domain-containing protein n=1 Tax=Paraphaeosphaeria sporulosa TaxID=1460663 RepID=A0A177CQQ7_9PLEO|nr:uncharacterized protein CC84DRAFT_1083823 [Paraphaeosphaeria sporulosa]OAG09561.1 hypothetical protein CC84DRAFT_1083823 [Paraphaeosphaeria sporulosa]